MRLNALCVHVWLLVSQCASKSVFTNSWAVEVRGGAKAADEVAQKHGFRNHGQVGNIPNVYHFKLVDTDRSCRQRRFDVPTHHKTLALHSESEIGLVEQQVLLHRVKKTYSPPTDPLWDEQWYLSNTGQTGADHFVRDLNVEPLWVQGVTGCNSIVAIVDDGVEYTHPDLNSNYAASLGYDYVDDDSNPFPIESSGQREDHGTSCAGEIAMVKNNGVCGVGVAYQSSITGIRLLGERSTTDIQEAMALSHLNVIIDIYSNSWGPSDNGNIVDGPGRLTQMALEQAVRQGRDGKGSIFMWAAGNGGRDDSCAADGYVNSIYTVAIGAAFHDGSVASFDEECSGKMATTFVSRQDRSSEITTTTVYSQCTDDFSGTSAACPLASATVALAFEVNTNLTWRDVQYLIVYTSNPSILSGGNWVTNGAGLNVSHQFGFGALDAEALVTRARRWITVPEQQVDTVIPNQTNRTATALSPLTITFLYGGSDIHFLEHVIATLTLTTGGRRGDIQVELTSPQGTTSTLLPYRSNDRLSGSFINWPFMSVHYWGEDPRGQWMLTVRFRGSTSSAVVSNLTVTFYGTAETPAAVQRIPTHCDPACLRGCAAAGTEFCDACVNLRNAHTLECINQCPPGYVERKNYCYNSTLPEPHCDRHIPAIPTPSLSSDSCFSAGHTTCCTSGDCTGTGSCYCDQGCYSLDDCCTDIRDICLPPVSDYLQFLKLGTSPGIQRVFLPQEDDGVSGAISISGEGFPFGNSIQKNVYVSTNGYLSFGESINDYSSVLFPLKHSFFVAPFWADIAVRSGVGTISYEVHTTRNGQNASQLLSLVNQFVSDHQRTNFTGDWMLVAEWKQVPAFQVNIGRTNTFQGVVVTDGSHSYAVFTYHCGLMDWNGRAVIGFNANNSLYQNHRLAGTSDANDIACLHSPDTVWSNVVYLLFVRDMPFLSLGTTVGVSRVFLSFPDDRHSNSISINISGGFPFGDSNQTTVYVGMDGFFSFGRAVNDWTPSYFPQEHDYMVAPYWAHIDIHDRNISSVSYEVHSASSNGSETSLLNEVSVFVSEWLQTIFEGKWMLLAEWSQVPQWRGNLSQTNTFQGILITDGSRSYTVFTYHCGSMEWSGSATIGFSADNDLFQNHPLSRTTSSNSIACQNYPDSVWNNLVYQLGGISAVVPKPSPTSSTGIEAPHSSTQTKLALLTPSLYLTQIATSTPAPVLSSSQDLTLSYPQVTSSPQATVFSQVPGCVQVPGCTQTTAFPREEGISTRIIVGINVGGGICAVLFILLIIMLIITHYKWHKRTVNLKIMETKDKKDQSPTLPFTSVVIDNVYATPENMATPVT